MRILLLVHHFPPDVNSTGLLMSRLFSVIKAEDHAVDVISTFPHYEGFRTWPEYRRHFAQRSVERGLPITRVYSFTSGSKSMRHRLLNYLTFNLSALLVGLVRRKRYDIVFCTNGSFFSGLSGYLISRRMRAKCVYNLQDLYPEVPVAQGQLTGRRQIAILGGIERFMYRRADRLTVITPSFKASLERKGVALDKIEVIPNFVDTDFITPGSKRNAFSERHDLDERFVVSHSGNIGYVYDLHTLLEAAELLAADAPDVAILIVGDGVAKADLVADAKRRRLANVVFLPFQAYEDVPLIRASSDVQVALYRPGASAFSMPSKIYEIMASGRPAIVSGDAGSDLRELIEQTECGISLEPGDAESLAGAILELRADPARRQAMGDRGRAQALQSFSLQRVARDYLELFQELTTA